MQHGTGPLHHAQNGNRQREPQVEGDDDHDDAGAGRFLREGGADGHVPEDDGELLVGEGEGPETEVGGCVGDAVEAEFDGVDDLVDHDFGEVEFFVFGVFVAEILGDHRDAFAGTFAFAGHAVAGAALVVVFLEGADAGWFAEATVALATGTIMLATEVEWLEEEHERDLGESKKQQDNLHSGLAGIERLVNGTRRQEHEDQHVEKTRGRLTPSLPIHRPFVQNGNDKVPEDRLEEDHSRNKITPDIDLGLEMPGVDILQAKGVGHLNKSASCQKLT